MDHMFSTLHGVTHVPGDILCLFHIFPVQIVYEDADYEDVTHSELRRIMWSNSTPSAKREACLKHAKLLGEFLVIFSHALTLIAL